MKIVYENVSSTTDLPIKILIYYKNMKLSNLFIKNDPFYDPRESHVLYQYTCPMTECQASEFYIGCRMTTLKQRMTTHAQKGSILCHSLDAHNEPVRTQQKLDNIDSQQSKGRRDVDLTFFSDFPGIVIKNV